MVEAINHHHTNPAEVSSLLGRLLVTADALAIAVDGITSEQNYEIRPCLESLDIPANSEQSLLEEIARDQENLAGFLTVKG